MGDNEIKITVKFNGSPIPVTTAPDSTVLLLKTNLLPLTCVIPRHQKLIFKGQLLADEVTLREAGVTHGSKLMLVGNPSVVHQTERPILNEAQTQVIAWKTDNKVPPGLSPRERWRATGVVGLAEHNLKAIPDEVWDCAPFIRVIDISNNSILRVPDQIKAFTGLKKLHLDANDLSDESISWVQLTALKRLTVLSIGKNCLNSLPGTLGRLTALQHIDVSSNKLTILPTEIGLLRKLEVFKAKHNRISFLPENIGHCTSLNEIDLSANLLSELPESLENLRSLKAFYLSNNALKSLPTTLFSKCVQLTTLDLHNTEITMDFLRRLQGWEDFDQRRRAKRQKQLDFKVME